MGAAHLAGPPVPKVTAPFVPGCTGRPRHTRREAKAAVARRGMGWPYRCRNCGHWHVVTGVPFAYWRSA